MSRRYIKRSKSTKRKSYQDYLDMRRDLRSKGYALKETMSEESFNEYYKRLQAAKKSGEIKSGAWQTLVSSEKYTSMSQSKALAKAATEMYGEKYTAKKIRGLNKDEISKIGKYLNEHKKEDTLFGGNYE